MKFLSLLVLGSLIFATAASAQDFRFFLGPFSLEFNPGLVAENRSQLDNPICRAISQQKRLQIIVEGHETVSTKEMRHVTKQLTVEPFAFGITRDGKPVLRGNVIEEKQLKEVTVKYDEDRFKEEEKNQKNKGYLSGWFSSDKSKNIDIRKVSDLQVIEDSHFDAPKNYKGVEDDTIRVICQLPVSQ